MPHTTEVIDQLTSLYPGYTFRADDSNCIHVYRKSISGSSFVGKFHDGNEVYEYLLSCSPDE